MASWTNRFHQTRVDGVRLLSCWVNLVVTFKRQNGNVV